jgi:hypothetical protein
MSATLRFCHWGHRPIRIPALAGLVGKHAQLAINSITNAVLVTTSFDAPVDVTGAVSTMHDIASVGFTGAVWRAMLQGSLLEGCFVSTCESTSGHAAHERCVMQRIRATDSVILALTETCPVFD